MGDPIRNNLSTAQTPTPARTAGPASGPPAPPAGDEPQSPEMSADEAAAELDLLAASHRRSPQRQRRTMRGPRLEIEPLTPRQVAEFAVAGSNTTRFFDAMEPLERTELMENLAKKLADGIIEDMQGMVEVFNGMRDGLNEGRRARGNEELPQLALDAGGIREILQHGMEAVVDQAVHSVLETALHAVFGRPSRLPHQQEPGDALAPLPEIQRDPNDRGLYLHWNRSF